MYAGSGCGVDGVGELGAEAGEWPDGVGVDALADLGGSGGR